MKRFILPLMALAISACHPLPLTDHQRQSFAGTHEEVVSDFNYWNTYDQVPFYLKRGGTDPLVGPFFYVFSKEHHFCLVSEHDYYYIARLNERYNCHWELMSRP